MFYPSGEYWTATRHPWSCALFVLPLLAIYEVGLHFLGPTPVAVLRNGADVWLRTGLGSAGIAPAYGAPVALVLFLLGWTFLYREARPQDPVGVWVGMTMESVLFAALLYGISQGLWPLLQSLNGMLDGRNGPIPTVVVESLQKGAYGQHAPEPALVNLVRFFGAGIYEEALFRLLLFSGLLMVFNVVELPRRWGIALAGVASSLLFAGAHNLGAHGEPFHNPTFAFRTLAGAYFAWTYCVRGFGVAVGAHAGYDLLVGLFVQPATS